MSKSDTKHDGPVVPDAQTGDSCVLTEDQALQMIAFLTSAAEISIHEPTYYGTFRLIDAASRLITFMLEREHDPPRSAEFLRELKTEIDTKKVWMMWDREAYFDFLRATPAVVAAEVMRLADEDGARQGEERS